MLHSFFSGRRTMALMLLAGLAAPALPAGAADLFPGIAGGDTVQYGIRDAIFTALERNPTVSIQRIAPDIASADARAMRSAFEPTIMEFPLICCRYAGNETLLYSSLPQLNCLF
jgi:hypothetical protein